MANNRFTPASWLTVLLAAVPGLLVVLSRRSASLLDQLLPILSIAYLGLLLIGIPLFWRRDRRFPAWALLPAGLLAWFAVYLAGVFLAEQWNTFGLLKPFDGAIESGIFLLQLILTFILFAVLLRGQRLPLSVWLTLGAYLLVNLIIAIQYIAYWPKVGLPTGVIQFLTVSGFVPIEGLYLVAVGLLAARQHGLRALLIVIGGYSYMCLDSDYFWPEFQPMGGLRRICRQYGRPLPDRHPGRHAARPYPPGVCPGNFSSLSASSSLRVLLSRRSCCSDNLRFPGIPLASSSSWSWPGSCTVTSAKPRRNPPLSLNLLPNLVHRSPVR